MKALTAARVNSGGAPTAVASLKSQFVRYCLVDSLGKASKTSGVRMKDSIRISTESETRSDPKNSV